MKTLTRFVVYGLGGLALSAAVASAQTPSEYAKSFGRSVACNILDFTLRLPIPLCEFAKAEFTNDLKKATLALKSQAYCGTANFSGARQMFDPNDDNATKCAAVLIISCKRYNAGC